MEQTTAAMSARIRKSVNALDPKAEILLYGSRARGDARPDSDWDLLILTDYPVDLTVEEKFRNQLYDLELESGEAISVFVYSKHEWMTQQRVTPFFHNVTEEGVKL
jgi:predicted nucleotidyltransferase